MGWISWSSKKINIKGNRCGLIQKLINIRERRILLRTNQKWIYYTCMNSHIYRVSLQSFGDWVYYVTVAFTMAIKIVFSNKANFGLPSYIKKKGKYRNVDENIDEFQQL